VNARRLRSPSAALLLLLLLLSAAGIASVRDDLVARWVAANDAQIAKIADVKKRAAAATSFAKVRGRLDESTTSSMLPDFTAAARRELATPGRYQLSVKVAPPPQPTLWEQLWQWAGDRLRDIWNALNDRVHIGPSGAVAIGDVLIGLAVLVLVFVVIRLLAEFQIDRRRAAAVEALGAPRDARVLYERATAAAQKGDFTAASRLLFAATVVALDLRGVVTEDPSATVGDLRRALRSRQTELVPPFDAVAAPFVASAYAERAIEPVDWDRAHAAFLTFAPGHDAT
jgi:hypothetical protein